MWGSAGEEGPACQAGPGGESNRAGGAFPPATLCTARAITGGEEERGFGGVGGGGISGIEWGGSCREGGGGGGGEGGA